MRMYKETPISLMGEAKKTTRKFNHADHGIKTEILCKRCGVPMMMSAANIKKYGTDKSCYTCHKEGIKEVKQAMINLARRKGLIK